MKKQNRGHSVGYFSAYYRGLEVLLRMWPEIRKQVPDATLDVYYGWESWVAYQGEDDFYHKMEDQFHKLKDDGVTVHGRVSHEALAKAMKQTKVWAYPTEFPEIHCITALKAQEAGCYPVVTNVAALNETVKSGTVIKSQRIYHDEYKQKKFIEAVVNALQSESATPPVDKTAWSDVAADWTSFISAKLSKEKLNDRN